MKTLEGRLSFLAAAAVVARRDFFAVLLSRSFLFFLLGPLFPLIVGALAGGVTQKVASSAEVAHIGIAMEGPEADAVIAAHRRLSPELGQGLPDMLLLKQLEAGETFDAERALAQGNAGLGAVLTGTPSAPVLTGAEKRIEAWKGATALIVAEALAPTGRDLPRVALAPTASSAAQRHLNRVMTAQAAQTLLFLLIMLLAGMVLSNLVEEKTNKIIEVLAAAIPMDAVFCGKLFAMLGVSLVGIAVWGAAGGAIMLVGGQSLPAMAEPAVGWPLFILLATLYFAMGYLLLGSIFLAIGGMASTVREVQTLSMPVTMMQLLVFFFATYAMAQPGSTIELAAIAFPPSSPFAMVARAAQQEALWPHVAAIAWQVLAVAVLVRTGAAIFRKRVMKSGPAPVRRGLFSKRKAT
jgi:ABC-2 type transport system permease protein